MGRPFNVAACLKFAREALKQPPAESWIDRGEPKGERVFEFVLPLNLCKPFNQAGRAGTASAGWALGKMKKEAYQRMWAQNGGKAKSPLPGRPHVVCVRFSSSAVGEDSGWTKNPVDRLRVKQPNGLGIIKDDERKDIKLMAWWEKAPRSEGFVYVAVFTGEEE